MKKSADKRTFMEGKRVPASITLYMALVMVLVLVLICTVTESGRVNAMNAKLRGITYLGMDAVFSEYALPVFEEYGVMMLWCKEEEFVRRFEEYLSYNLEETVSGLPAAAFCNADHLETTLSEVKKAPDDNGKLFEEQVYEYMKYYLVESAAEKILEKAGLFDQADKANDLMDKVKKHQKTFTEVEESVGRLKEKTEKVQKYADDPAYYLGRISDGLDKYERTQEDVFLNDVYINENELIAVRYEISDGLESVSKEAEIYHEKAQRAKAAIDEMESGLYVDAEGMPPDVYQCMEEELSDLRQKAGDSEADFYRIEETMGTIEACQEKTDSLDGVIQALDTDINETNAGQIHDVVNRYQEAFRDFDLSGLTVNFDTSRTDKESSRFLSVISEIFGKGIQEYVAPDASSKKVSLEGIPSKERKAAPTDEGGLAEAGLKKVVFSEYILRHFGNYTDVKEEKALDYETEYILGGKASDKQNLKYVIDRIILIRQGCNLLSIFMDSEKKAEAYALAAAIVGFTGMPVLVKIMQLLILSAWSLAEAIVDAKTLFEGGKVPAIKKSHEWELSLSAVKKFSRSSIHGGGSEKGLDYGDYLRIMLLAQNKGTQILRTLDMIQLNMAKKENPDFKLSDCILKAQVDVSFSADPLFVRLPFVIRNIGTVGDYHFDLRQQYSY